MGRVQLQIAASAALVLLGACHGKPEGDHGKAPAKVAPRAVALGPIDGGTLSDAGATPRHGKAENKPDEPVSSDAAASDSDLLRHGAMPAWQAVITRSELLARRGQHGVIFGRVGTVVPGLVVAPVAPPANAATPPKPAVAPTPAPVTPRADDPPLIWLIDDSEGGGSLGVRVAFRGVPPPAGSRVAVGGAWTIDSGRRWYWRADSLTSLPAQAATDPAPTGEPSHAIATAEVPAGSHPVSAAKDDGVITFQVVGVAAHDGDGWLIADENGNPPVALLTLPGERATFGGDDLRQADERWTLRKGVSYWVRIGKVRHRTADAQEILNARGAPSKY